MADQTKRETLSGYDAAQSGAAYYRVPDPGYLRIAGADRLDYIQRQTTNDVRALAADGSLLTVLTNGTARILDVWRLVGDDGDSVGVVTLPGRGPSTAAYLQKRIFFMDKVTVRDHSAEIAQWLLAGPGAPEALAALGLDSLAGPEAVATVESGGARLTVIGMEAGWRLLAPASAADDVQARLDSAGAAALSAAAYAALRVEAGQPGPDHELTDDYTPLETNLDAAISSTKGCYSGQEIIARQVTYDKVTRRLAGLRLADPVAVGASVTVEGRTAGTITSVVESPRLGWIALAVLKRPHFEPGTSVVVGEAQANAEVVALPFDSVRFAAL